MPSQTFNTAGDFTFTVPAFVISLDAECYGAGGYGRDGDSKGGGQAAGGGSYAADFGFSVTPGDVINGHVGAGGTSITIDGAFSWFRDSKTGPTAQPGLGGLNGGTGGDTSTSVGTIKFRGGNGAAGGSGGGGGGGSVATSSHAGGDGTAGGASLGGAGGATTPSGGFGANGGNTGANSSGGTAPGGGGGGGGASGGLGHTGYDGQVVITWTVPSQSVGPDLITRSHTLYSPTIKQKQVLGPDETIRSHTLYSPTIKQRQVLGPTVQTRSHTVFSPTIHNRFTLGPTSQTRSHTLFTPKILQRQLLGPTSQTRSHTLYSPTIHRGQILGPNGITRSSGMFFSPNIHVGTPTALGPDFLQATHTLFNPSVGGIIPTNCWRMYYSPMFNQWVLDGGNGFFVYGMTDDFRCQGSNTFDVLLASKTTIPLPPSIEVLPYTTANCDCVPQCTTVPCLSCEGVQNCEVSTCWCVTIQNAGVVTAEVLFPPGVCAGSWDISALNATYPLTFRGNPPFGHDWLWEWTGIVNGFPLEVLLFCRQPSKKWNLVVSWQLSTSCFFEITALNPGTFSGVVTLFTPLTVEWASTQGPVFVFHPWTGQFPTNWIAAEDPLMKCVYDGPGTPTLAPGFVANTPLAGPERAATSSRSKLPCRHLGEATGEKVLCQTCTGRVQLTVLKCEVYGSCTVSKQAPGKACCATCPDYLPRAVIVG